MILDVGKKTIEIIYNKIDESNTVLWNGPAGYFENDEFKNGTMSIAKKISDNTKSKSLISVLGGGDTLSAINKSNEYIKDYAICIGVVIKTNENHHVTMTLLLILLSFLVLSFYLFA